MVDQPPTFDDSSIQWESATSKNGVSFRIGRPKTESAEGDKPKAGVTNKNPFDIKVSWPVVWDWTATTRDVKDRAAITRYLIADQPSGTLYRYVLDFTCTETYDYTFYDKTGDSYGCNTWKTGNHFVNYDSDSPEIVRVTGRQ